MKIKEIIERANLDYVNEEIRNLMPVYDGTPTVGELHHFNKDITSGDVILELDKLGLRPGTLPELLAYQIANPNSKEWVVALGTQFMFYGSLRAPCLVWNGDERYLDASGVSGVWSAWGRFLFVRKSLDISSLDSTSDTLTLAIEQVKNAGYQVSKIM